MHDIREISTAFLCVSERLLQPSFVSLTTLLDHIGCIYCTAQLYSDPTLPSFMFEWLTIFDS